MSTSKILFRFLLVAAACVALFPHSTSAQGNGHAYGKQKHQAESDDENDDDDRRDRDHDHGGNRGKKIHVSVIFASGDRDMIRDYFRDHNANLPPGLAKRDGNLPPGLRKHLERNGTLPPGLQKRLEPFPDDLDRRLPELPGGYVRAVIGVDVIILDRRTQRIVDVIHDLLRP